MTRPEATPRHEVMIAYGARCTWWDDKTKVGQKPSGLPCCPHCGGVLFESEMVKWWSDAHQYENDGNADYVAFLRWLRGRCFRDHVVARAVYDTARAEVQEEGGTE